MNLYKYIIIPNRTCYFMSTSSSLSSYSINILLPFQQLWPPHLLYSPPSSQKNTWNLKKKLTCCNYIVDISILLLLFKNIRGDSVRKSYIRIFYFLNFCLPYMWIAQNLKYHMNMHERILFVVLSNLKTFQNSKTHHNFSHHFKTSMLTQW